MPQGGKGRGQTGLIIRILSSELAVGMGMEM